MIGSHIDNKRTKAVIGTASYHRRRLKNKILISFFQLQVFPELIIFRFQVLIIHHLFGQPAVFLPQSLIFLHQLGHIEVGAQGISRQTGKGRGHSGHRCHDDSPHAGKKRHQGICINGPQQEGEQQGKHRQQQVEPLAFKKVFHGFSLRDIDMATPGKPMGPRASELLFKTAFSVSHR